ncbi:MAG: hypothetical protein ACKO8I_13935 [Cyanobacteriota bacterium]
MAALRSCIGASSSEAELSGNLLEQRATMLRNSLPGSLRVLFGAAIVSAFLFLLHEQI